MNCEEFEVVGLEPDSYGEVSPLREAALEHLRQCSRCAALHESWQAARAELRALGAETRDLQAPGRVEMRLRQEFRTKYRTEPARRTVQFAGWALATAALLIGMVGWWNWREKRQEAAANRQVVPHEVNAALRTPAAGDNGLAQQEEPIVADNEGGEFTWLPGSVPVATEDSEIVRVRMQRGALGAFGLPVNEERAGEWVQVDLLVAADGQPEAVRLPE